MAGVLPSIQAVHRYENTEPSEEGQHQLRDSESHTFPSNLKAGYHPFPAEVNPKQDINCPHEAIECITKDQSPHRYVNLKSGRIQGLEEETALFVTLKPGKNLENTEPSGGGQHRLEDSDSHTFPCNLKAGYRPFPAEVNPKEDVNCYHEAIECTTKDQSHSQYVNLKPGIIQGLEEETAVFVTLKPSKNFDKIFQMFSAKCHW